VGWGCRTVSGINTKQIDELVTIHIGSLLAGSIRSIVILQYQQGFGFRTPMDTKIHRLMQKSLIQNSPVYAFNLHIPSHIL
jgi:hypothetical protein